MATVEDLLKKRETKKKFLPETHRAWDYVVKEDNKALESDLKAPSSAENGSQLEHKRDTQPITNGSQMVHNWNTNGSQMVHKKVGKSKTVHKRDTQPITNGSQKETQKEHKWFTNGSQKGVSVPFASLVGAQRKIILVFYLNCRVAGKNVTQEMTIDHIANIAKINKKSVKTTINRLKEKNCIAIESFKSGRGGWVKYELAKNLYSELLHGESELLAKDNGSQMVHKWFTNGTQLEHKRDTQPITQPITSLSSSSSYINKTTTTGEEGTEPVLTDDWQNIQIEGLADIGFTRTHLQQITQQAKLTAEMVQTSIHAFAFDLKHNDKAKTLKTSPLNYFMGILRNGQPYAPPANYETPEMLALRHYVERQQALEDQRAKMENSAFEFAFSAWQAQLSEEEKNQLLPAPVRNFKAEQPKVAHLKEHFRQTIWPVRRNEILQAGQN